ncbi:MAG: CheR family methyltransferase [Acidimicrobiales bacterium]
MTSMATGEQTREFVFEDNHFELLRTLARENVGIELNDTKRALVYGRLTRRLRALQLDNFDDYCRLLSKPNSPEMTEFVNSITTNVTAFFREPHHFDFLKDVALPHLLKSRPDRRLRMWSAAASTGQEPYSIAASAAEVLGPQSDWDCKILATDIDSEALARGEAGLYSAQDVPDDLGSQRRWFNPTSSGGYQMDKALQEMLFFRQLNLMGPWPMSGKIDVIFCRNVVIYFSVETQRRLFSRFAEIIAPDGYLFIGHSESMLHSADLFTMVGRTIYRPAGTAG